MSELIEKQQGNTKEKDPLVTGKKTGGSPPVGSRFKPGQSGNPSGRPKGVSLTTAIIKVLKESDPDDTTGKRKRLDTLALAIIQQAAAGNKTAIQQIWERLDGIVQPANTTDDRGDIDTLIAALSNPENIKQIFDDDIDDESSEVLDDKT